MDGVDDWTGGLHWADPFCHDSHLSPEEQREFDRRIGAIEAEAKLVDEALAVVSQAEGSRHVDSDGRLRQRVQEGAVERLFSAPRLACDHDGNLEVWTIWAGPFVALACPRGPCQEALEDHITRSMWLGWCSLCDERSRWLPAPKTILSFHVSQGRLQAPVHLTCLPDAVAATQCVEIGIGRRAGRP